MLFQRDKAAQFWEQNKRISIEWELEPIVLSSKLSFILILQGRVYTMDCPGIQPARTQRWEAAHLQCAQRLCLPQKRQQKKWAKLHLKRLFKKKKKKEACNNI